MMMQISRRNFLLAGAALGAGAAFGLFPRTANANNYWLVSACSNKNNEHFVAALDMQGQLRCQVQLPARGHDVIALANKPGHVIAFARRPGTFAMEVDLLKGEVVNEIHALADSHFYGHGTFSAKHNVLITSENRFASGEGRIVLRDARDYSLLESYPSGGIGPHQIALMPGEDSLVIANGGIRTHPDQPRKKLNLDTMAPNLAYLDLSNGKVVQSHRLDNPKLSIRHLAVSTQGKVVAGLQYQGAKNDLVPLAIAHQGQDSLQYLKADEDTWRRMNQYTASVCIDEAQQVVAISCPRADLITYWSLRGNSFIASERLADGAGLTFTDRLYASSGKGRVVTSKTLGTDREANLMEFSGLKWDNHLAHIEIG